MKGKIWTVFQREYIQRLTSKAFIISTLLVPIGLVVLFGVSIFAAILSETDTAARTISVVDETGVVGGRLALPESYVLNTVTESREVLRQQVLDEKIDGYLILPAILLDGEGKAEYYSGGGGGIVFREKLLDSVNDAVRSQRLENAEVSEEVQGIFRKRVGLEMFEVNAGGQTSDATAALTAVGYIMGFIIYMAVFIYGSLVMRSVMEEKTSRIVEVVVSSVRPFQLMMGKVLGMGALGVTQLVIWSAASMALLTFGGTIAALFMDTSGLGGASAADSAEAMQAMDSLGISMPTIPISLFVYFVLFFVGGYLLYASMFAAVGSIVEQESDSQQFVLPVSIPIILAIIFLPFITTNPDNTMSVVLSLVPLMSPVLMIARAAITDVPFWQMGTSLVLLAATFIGSIWLSARIYRVGILMYGKRPRIKDIVKWIRYA